MNEQKPLISKGNSFYKSLLSIHINQPNTLLVPFHLLNFNDSRMKLLILPKSELLILFHLSRIYKSGS